MLIDSNVLIYSLTTTSHKHEMAQLFLQSDTQLSIAQQNIFETMRILTHTRFPHPFSVERAIAAIQKITDSTQIISPTLETVPIALALIQKYQIKGLETFDAYLVATALSNDITTIATDNIQHFKKYTEIKVVNPFQ